MEKRNWKRSVTLKQRMVLCLAAFFAAFALQLALNGYQARAVQQVQDDQMGNFNAISRFQGGVESSISILEAYRWENGETEEMLEKLRAACSTSNAWLWRIRFNMDSLQNVSDEQWVLYGAVETTYGSYSALLEDMAESKFALVAEGGSVPATHPLVRSGYAVLEAMAAHANSTHSYMDRNYFNDALTLLDDTRDAEELEKLKKMLNKF